MKITFQQNIAAGLRPNDHPYLNGAHMPLHEEVDADDLDVIEGAIPRDIDGVYLRNTQNQCTSRSAGFIRSTATA